MIKELKLFGWYKPTLNSGSYVEYSLKGLQDAILKTGINVDSSVLEEGFLLLKDELKREGFLTDVVDVWTHESDGSHDIWKSVRNKLQGR